jgi:hypothetical protein
VYRANDRERHVAPARAATQIAIAGTVASGLTAMAGLNLVSWVVLASAGAVALWKWRWARDVSGLLLRVEDGDLVITTRASKEVLTHVRLGAVRDVSLDTKSIRKVEPGRDAVPAVQFIHTQVGPEIDVARIVLDLEGRSTPIRLSDAYVSHIDSVEWLGKIRSFLRAHGWIPVDEREDGYASDEHDEHDEDEDAAAPQPTRRGL